MRRLPGRNLPHLSLHILSMRKPVNAPLAPRVDASTSRSGPPPPPQPPQGDEPPGRGNKSSKPAPTHPEIRPLPPSPFWHAVWQHSKRVQTPLHYKKKSGDRRSLRISCRPPVFSSLEADPAKRTSQLDVFPSERLAHMASNDFSIRPTRKISDAAVHRRIKPKCSAGLSGWPTKQTYENIFFSKITILIDCSWCYFYPLQNWNISFLIHSK